MFKEFVKMQINDETLIDAIQKAAKVDAVERLLWDIKGSIKQDIQIFANQTKQDIVNANQLQMEQFKHIVKDAISENNEKNLKPLREDIGILKSDKKAFKWVVISVSSIITFIGSVINFIFIK
jgi:hypothetical protein